MTRITQGTSADNFTTRPDNQQPDVATGFLLSFWIINCRGRHRENFWTEPDVTWLRGISGGRGGVDVTHGNSGPGQRSEWSLDIRKNRSVYLGKAGVALGERLMNSRGSLRRKRLISPGEGIIDVNGELRFEFLPKRTLRKGRVTHSSRQARDNTETPQREISTKYIL